MYADDDLLPISALQHLQYCERQCALIHIEDVWSENALTAQGRVLHNRVDSGGHETRGCVRTVYSLRLRSLRLGLTGQADVVEFHLGDNQVWTPWYKHPHTPVGKLAGGPSRPHKANLINRTGGAYGFLFVTFSFERQ